MLIENQNLFILLAKEKHTSWNPDLIYFNNKEVKPTANYYVQRAFGQNAGDTYVYSDLTVDYKQANGKKTFDKAMAERIDKSVVIDSATGDMIVKLVNLLPNSVNVTLEGTEAYDGNAQLITMSTPDSPDRARAWTVNETSQTAIGNGTGVTIPAYSLNIIRLKKKITNNK